MTVDCAALVASAPDAFIAGFSAALLVGAPALLVGAVVGGLLAPAHSVADDVEASEAVAP